MSAASVPLRRGEVSAVGTVGVLVVTAVLGLAAAFAGAYRPTPLLIALIVAVAAVLRAAQQRPISAWPAREMMLAAAVGAVALVHVLRSGQDVFMRRDAAAYLNKSRWLAETGGLRDRIDPAAFPGFDRPGFGEHNRNVTDIGDGELVFEFTNGTSVLLATAEPLGTAAVFSLTALVAMLAVVLLHLLARRCGAMPSVSLAGALVLALSGPFTAVARSTYSEPYQASVLLAGLIIAVVAIARGGRVERRGLPLAAALVGSSQLFRVDGLLYVAIFLGALTLALIVRGGGPLALRHRLAVVAAAGVPVAVGLFDLVFVAVDYGARLRDRWEPLALAAVIGTVLFLAATGPSGRRVAEPWLRWATRTPAVGRIAAGLSIAWALPLLAVQTQPLESVSYWFGPGLVVAAALGLHVLLSEGLSGRSGGATLVAAFTAFAVPLYILQPSIWADQPWASRRLMGIAAFALFLLAAVGLSALLRAALRRPWRGVQRGVGALLAVMLVAWTLHSLASVRQHQPRAGEHAILMSICDGLVGADRVVVIGYPYAAFPVRAACQVPVTIASADLAGVDELVRRSRAEGEQVGFVTTVGHAASVRMLIGGDAQGRIVRGRVGPWLQPVDDSTRQVAGRHPVSFEHHAFFVGVG